MKELTKEFDGIRIFHRKEFLKHATYHQGQKEKQLEIAKNLLKTTTLTIEEISKNTDLSLKEVEQLKILRQKNLSIFLIFKIRKEHLHSKDY